MDLLASMYTSESGMKAQAARLKIASQNLANKDSTSNIPNGNPYRRKTIFFSAVQNTDLNVDIVEVSKYDTDPSAFNLKFEPHHPAANIDGYVKYPNVNHIIEAADTREANLMYEANLGVISTARNMIMKALELLSLR